MDLDDQVEASADITSASDTSSEKFDRVAVEDKVEARLAVLNAGDPDFDPQAEDAEDASESADPKAAESEDASQDEAGQETQEEPAEAVVTEPAKQPVSTAPTLPDAHRRSLVAYGWTPEEIDRSLAGLGTPFLETAAKMHVKRNDELQRWAQAGRTAKQSPSSDADPTPSGAEARQPAQQGMAALDVAKLKAEYGDDPILDAIVAPVNAVIQTINSLLPSLQAGQQLVDRSRTEEVGKAVESFFDDKPLQSFGDLYGSPAKGLTGAQLESRSKVLELAHDLIVGAKTTRGEQLSLRDALTYAHDLVTRDRQEKSVRDQLTQSLAKRQRSIVTRPSGSGKAVTTGPAKSRAEAEARAGQRLREVFGT